MISAHRLAKWDKAFKEFCQNALRPAASQKQSPVDQLFPTVAQFVRGSGWIEIGDQQGVGFVARAVDYGGLVFEDGTSRTLAEALAALERGLEEQMK